MAHRSLRLAAAYYALGMASKDVLIDAADDALNDCIYSYSLGELATLRNPTWADSSRLFVNALEELETPMPDPAGAIAAVLEFNVVRLAEGVASPDDVIRELYAATRNLRDECPRAKVPAAALEPLQPFVDQYYALDELLDYQGYWQESGLPPPEDGSLERLRTRVLALAGQWCRNRWGPAMDARWLTPNVTALVRGIVADAAFDGLPILADALQDEGCTDESILDHLRCGAPHTRCCFVVDLLRGLG